MADIPSSTSTLQEGVGDGQSIALFLRTHVPAQCKRTVQGDRGGRGPGLGWPVFGQLPRLLGRKSSYLLLKQEGGTSQIQVNPTKVCDHRGLPAQYMSGEIKSKLKTLYLT